MPRNDCVCPQCGEAFRRKKSDIARGRVYCSHACSVDAHRRPIADRFWEKVEKTDTCWLWTATRAGLGQKWHGILFSHKDRGRTRFVKAHRVSWEIHNGPIPEGMNVLHRCDVPHCVNPEHLFLGTSSDNTNDMVAKGRQGKQMKPGGNSHRQRNSFGQFAAQH